MISCIFKFIDAVPKMVGFATTNYASSDKNEIVAQIEENDLINLVGEEWQDSYSGNIVLVGDIPLNTSSGSLTVEGCFIQLSE